MGNVQDRGPQLRPGVRGHTDPSADHHVRHQVGHPRSDESATGTGSSTSPSPTDVDRIDRADRYRRSCEHDPLPATVAPTGRTHSTGRSTTSNGQTYDQLGNPNAPTPELVVFFTDGVPTFDRIGGGSYTGSTVSPTPARSVHRRFHPDSTAQTDGGGDPLRQRLQPARVVPGRLHRRPVPRHPHDRRRGR